MKVLYTLNMTTPELIFFIVAEALMAICIISHIFIATVWTFKGVRLFFCMFSVIVVCLCVVVTLVIEGLVFVPFADSLKAIEEAPFFIAALAVAASCEFTGTLYLLKKRKPKEEKATPFFMGEAIDYSLPDNTRKRGERKHAEYKIIKEKK